MIASWLADIRGLNAQIRCCRDRIKSLEAAIAASRGDDDLAAKIAATKARTLAWQKSIDCRVR